MAAMIGISAPIVPARDAVIATRTPQPVRGNPFLPQVVRRPRDRRALGVGMAGAPLRCVKRILILYASNHGQTRTIAFELERELRALGADVAVHDVTANELPEPTAFDAVVLGSRIQFGRHAPAMVAYIRTHRAALEQVPTAFFSVSMAAANGGNDPNGYLDTLFSAVGWKPRIAVALAGALPYRRYNFILRFVMKRIARAGGHSTDTTRNHEYTRWDQVHELVTVIGELTSAPRRESHAS